MDGEHIKDLVLQLLLPGVVTYVASLIRSLVKSINELNQKVAKILDHIGDHENRLRKLEKIKK